LDISKKYIIFVIEKRHKVMAKEKKEKEEKVITPSQYFDYLKGAKNTITTEALKNSYDVFLKLAEKYQKIGQVESLKKLCFLADTLVKEEKLIELGITTYVYKDTIEDYIENVADKTVKIVELSRYMREIPDELIDTIERTKNLFDEFYVVFTDYTGKEERKIEKEKRDKDPILFGVFKNRTNVADRFYFLGDWVDEYCDLTLDKMVEQYKEANGYSPVVTTGIPTTGEELVAILKTYKIDEKKGNSFVTLNAINDGIPEGESLPTSTYVADNKIEKKTGFFSKIRSIFKK
jgi:hypothetical protein